MSRLDLWRLDKADLIEQVLQLEEEVKSLLEVEAVAEGLADAAFVNQSQVSDYLRPKVQQLIDVLSKTRHERKKR